MASAALDAARALHGALRPAQGRGRPAGHVRAARRRGQEARGRGVQAGRHQADGAAAAGAAAAAAGAHGRRRRGRAQEAARRVPARPTQALPRTHAASMRRRAGGSTRPEGTSLFGRAGGGGRGGGARPGARGGARDQGRRGRHQARRRQRAAQLVPARRRARGARLTGSPPRAPRDRGPLRAVVHGGAPAVEPRALGVHQGGRASWARSTRATGPSRRACTPS